jgi:hypothetical protein
MRRSSAMSATPNTIQIWVDSSCLESDSYVTVVVLKCCMMIDGASSKLFDWLTIIKNSKPYVRLPLYLIHFHASPFCCAKLNSNLELKFGRKKASEMN